MMKTKLLISMLCLELTCVTVTFAAGFGVAGQPPTMAPQPSQQPAINQLLTSSSSDINSVVQPVDGGSTVLGVDTAPAPLSAPVQSAPAASNPPVNGNGYPDPGQQAFAQTARSMMPLSPEQIKVLRYMFDQSQRAAAAYPGTPPRPTSSTVLVNLSPGATPPLIRLRAGYVTSLVFLDSTGQPWPIVAYDLGDPQAFNIQPNQPDGKSNTLLVQSLDSFKSGNLAVMLKDQNTPIMLTLLPG